MMRSLVRLAIVAFAACAAAEPAAAQMDGSYDMVGINSQPLPVLSPGEDGVLVHKAVLLLMPDGRFFMRARANVDDSPEPVEEKIEGTYSVTDDSLALTPDDTASNGEMRFRFTFAEDTLRLYNAEGHEYTFRRQR